MVTLVSRMYGVIATALRFSLYYERTVPTVALFRVVMLARQGAGGSYVYIRRLYPTARLADKSPIWATLKGKARKGTVRDGARVARAIPVPGFGAIAAEPVHRGAACGCRQNSAGGMHAASLPRPL